MKNLARLFLLISGTLLLAYYLPIGWHILTASRTRTPFIQYSDIGHGFLITRTELKEATKEVSIRYTDTAGCTYERDAFEQMLPLTYSAQLYKNGTMPKQLNGVTLTPSLIRREMWSLRLEPDSLDTPGVPLYTVFESGNGRARLEMPGDYMRINADGRIEFLSPKTNKVLPEKSTLYTEAFARAKFAFPATVIGANPNPLKSYDEGIYLTDSDNQLYRLRQIKGAPELLRIADVAADPAAWRALRPKNIIVNEIETQELRALIIDTDGQPWLGIGENFTLIKLPADSYTPKDAIFTLRGNLFTRLLIIQSSEKITAVALNREYKTLDHYEEILPSASQCPAAVIAHVIFPFTWWLNDDSSGYYNFFTGHGGTLALALNATLLIAYIIFLYARRQLALARIPEFAAIAATGVCGLITALLLPRSE